ncbi:unnamed protein product [Choristocarpus tenellus]
MSQSNVVERRSGHSPAVPRFTLCLLSTNPLVSPTCTTPVKYQKREQGFPKGCVKRIMKLGEDTRNVSGEALLLITKASELFLERFAKETFRHAHEEGRRAIKYQDVSDVRVADPNLIFLEAVVPP